MFVPFFRLEGSRSRTTGGVGLGLSIARTIVRGHGGDIELARSARRRPARRDPPPASADGALNALGAPPKRLGREFVSKCATFPSRTLGDLKPAPRANPRDIDPLARPCPSGSPRSRSTPALPKGQLWRALRSTKSPTIVDVEPDTPLLWVLRGRARPDRHRSTAAAWRNAAPARFMSTAPRRAPAPCRSLRSSRRGTSPPSRGCRPMAAMRCRRRGWRSTCRNAVIARPA